MANLRVFVGTIYDDWVALMSGVGGLAFTVAGFWVPSEWARAGFFGLGLILLFVCCYRAWLAEHKRCLTLQERRSAKLLLHQLARLRDFAVRRFLNERPANEAEEAQWVRLCERWRDACLALLKKHGLGHRISTLGLVPLRARVDWSPTIRKHTDMTLERLDRIDVIIKEVERRVVLDTMVPPVALQ